MSEETLFDLSRPSRAGVSLPEPDVPVRPLEELLPGWALRKTPADLPELSEVDVVRHFTRLSTLNYHVDKGIYPLGSCTMKYNPKINEAASRNPRFAAIHPHAPDSVVQGALRLLYELAGYLAEISGMARVTLQPAAGAHGELAGMLIVRACHQARGEPRKRVIIPDSAHGTNPASVAIAGYEPVVLASGKDGLLDLEALETQVDEQTAAMMATNPNTLGLFERNIGRAAEILHSRGALLYMDGANLNALLGRARPGDLGVDVLHFNLHKTFSTPHGGGGPGAGPVGVKKELEPFLPVPVLEKKAGSYGWSYDRPLSIGRLHGQMGNFGVLVRAYVYIRMHGAEGLKKVTEMAVLNANYIRKRLEGTYQLPYPGDCLHECVFSGNLQKARGVRTLDIAKRLLDYGFHAPTIYFPLIVQEALMVEPTETESMASLDAFCEAMLAIDREARENPELAAGAPHTTPVGRLNEGKAARELNVCCPWPGLGRADETG
ncbi:MAG: aminomethyl-transferring glycine dehydrogenase subunit GcvPB [Candidatus Glassbacteria bacterium]|nr:aminomethyl-transferring glycine dehydrogenase subunit GcvPB [Candidatus Glassbacteria bacterium]